MNTASQIARLPGRSALPFGVGPAACALAAWAVLTGCRREGDGRPLVVAISGDTSGWIVPCGCASNQYGGLPRRGDFLQSLRRDHMVIVADVGGAAGGVSPYDRARFEAILRGELLLGVAAHNLGASEAALGPESLRELHSRLGVPWVSANVRDRQGQLVSEPLRIVPAGTRRVALIGVLDPKFATPHMRVDPPQEAVLRTLHEAAGQFDSAIVLAYLPPESLREMARLLPEVDAVVGGPTGQPIATERVGPVLVTSATNKGKFLVRLDAAPQRGTAWSANVVAMDGQWADDPAQTANVREFYAELARRRFTPDETQFAENASIRMPDDYRLAGTETCRKCHAEEAAAWDRSQHAVAWQSLVAKGAHVDPECQRCHTTGYGLPGGFASVERTAARVQVGCESCHGPSAAHAANDRLRTARSGLAKDQCLACHDRENSPVFRYDPYWERVRHGQPATGGRGPVDDKNKRSGSSGVGRR